MLDDRKLKILYAIINSYIQSAEPIGSRTITKQYDLGVSPATIRNEMSDLEDLGFLNKPHSSAGRIPSDKAYRLYVDELLKIEHINVDLSKKEEMKSILRRESRQVDQLLQNSAKLLSALTNYTALALSPKTLEMKIKHIQLLPINSREVLLILISDTGMVKNTLFTLNKDISDDDILIITRYLNENLKDKALDEIGDQVSSIPNDMQGYRSTIDIIIPLVFQTLGDIYSVDLYAEGITKILDFPEYKDLDKARSLISFIEEKEMIVDMLLENSFRDNLEITIGTENENELIKECSIITANYKLGDKVVGKIGIIGPTRMDYGKVINNLNLVSSNISEIINILLGKYHDL